MGHGSKETTTETQQTTKGVLPNLQTTFKGKEMKTTFKDIKEIRKGYHKMPDGTIMKDSDHPKKVKEEELEERVRASASTKAKILKPLDRTTRNAIRLKVKNMISDLDYIAWQFENQLDVAQRTVILTTKQADRIIKELKSLERIL